MEKEVFFCLCGHNEHQMIVSIIPDDADTTVVYLSMNLSDNLPFFRRLVLGIKYIFGHRSNYGMFSEVLLDERETYRLASFLKKALFEKGSDVPN